LIQPKTDPKISTTDQEGCQLLLYPHTGGFYSLTVSATPLEKVLVEANSYSGSCCVEYELHVDAAEKPITPLKFVKTYKEKKLYGLFIIEPIFSPLPAGTMVTFKIGQIANAPYPLASQLAIKANTSFEKLHNRNGIWEIQTTVGKPGTECVLGIQTQKGYNFIAQWEVA